MSLSLLLLACLTAGAAGHGRLLDPPGRSTAWRLGFPTEKYGDDAGLNCGGFWNQWGVHKGKCGICGDAFELPTPRPHELGGKYGSGLVVANYHPGASIPVTVDLTRSHLGYWELRLCDDPQNNDQECFDQHVLELEDGGTKYYPIEGSKKYELTYRLPPGLVCDHCVLQWKYTAGNNWGVCEDGQQMVGCGNQEQFRACSDISITTMKSGAERFNLVESMSKKDEEYEEYECNDVDVDAGADE